jgi:hypothetical protein
MPSIETLNNRLAVALRKRDKELALQLCQQGADPNCEDRQFLIEAVKNLDIEAIEFLLEIGAKPNETKAVFSIFEYLIDASVLSCREFTEKRLLISNQYRRGEISPSECDLQIKKLEKHYEKEEIHVIKLKIAKMLLDAGADINHFFHPLKSALRNNKTEFRIVIFFILNCKLDLSDCDEDYKKTVYLWTFTATFLKDFDKTVKSNNIEPLFTLTRRKVLNALNKAVAIFGDDYESLVNNNCCYGNWW